MYRRPIRAAVPFAALAVAVVVAGCTSGGSSSSSAAGGSSAPVTIKAVLPPNTGAITSAENAGLKLLNGRPGARYRRRRQRGYL